MDPSSRPRQEFGGKQLSDRLLIWYDAHGRSLPWRAKPGEPRDPYGVWLSEIMLQQTTVVTVEPYYVDFIGRWPTVGALARADLNEILTAWAGLGYYARALRTYPFHMRTHAGLALLLSDLILGQARRKKIVNAIVGPAWPWG